MHQMVKTLHEQRASTDLRDCRTVWLYRRPSSSCECRGL